jgi:hypothetical protein
VVALLSKASWVEVLRRLWGTGPREGFAVGFLFDSPKDWARPDETLDQRLQDRRRNTNLGDWPTSADIPTRFMDGSGRACAERSVRFVRIARSPRSLLTEYVVDERDLDGFFRTIVACAVRSSEYGLGDTNRRGDGVVFR